MSQPVELLKQKTDSIETKLVQTAKSKTYDLATLTDGRWTGSLRLIQEPFGVAVIINTGILDNDFDGSGDLQCLDEGLGDIGSVPIMLPTTSDTYKLIMARGWYEFANYSSGLGQQNMFYVNFGLFKNNEKIIFGSGGNAEGNCPDMTPAFCVQGFIPDATLIEDNTATAPKTD